MEFPAIPGSYPLLNGEGTINVEYAGSQSMRGSIETKIIMTTTGNGVSYNHPNVLIPGSTRQFNFGHLSYNFVYTHTTTVRFVNKSAPPGLPLTPWAWFSHLLTLNPGWDFNSVWSVVNGCIVKRVANTGQLACKRAFLKVRTFKSILVHILAFFFPGQLRLFSIRSWTRFKPSFMESIQSLVNHEVVRPMDIASKFRLYDYTWSGYKYEVQVSSEDHPGVVNRGFYGSIGPVRRVMPVSVANPVLVKYTELATCKVDRSPILNPDMNRSDCKKLAHSFFELTPESKKEKTLQLRREADRKSQNVAQYSAKIVEEPYYFTKKVSPEDIQWSVLLDHPTPFKLKANKRTLS